MKIQYRTATREWSEEYHRTRRSATKRIRELRQIGYLVEDDIYRDDFPKHTTRNEYLRGIK